MHVIQRVDFDILYGIFRLLRGPYLCLVTRSEPAATGPGRSTIFRITGAQLLSFVPLGPGGKPLPAASSSSSSSSPSSSAVEADDRRLQGLIQSIFATRSLFFARNYDITHSAQRIADVVAAATESPATGFDPTTLFATPAATSADLLATARAGHARSLVSGTNPLLSDSRFFWNRPMSEELLAGVGTAAFVTPVISGFIESVRGVNMDGTVFDLLLLSRRSRLNQGTRFFVRGLDTNGNAANFVETEQLLLGRDGSLSSFVQIRGSIPLRWDQLPSLKWAPRCVLSDDKASNQALFDRHFGELTKNYGEVLAVNLIDQKGDQRMLGEAYAEGVKHSSLHRIKLEWFDFHRECARMRWHNLSKLLTAVEAEIARHGFFRADGAGRILHRQAGVVRTNCMDNLDRTNVVQSLFARRAALSAVAIDVGNGRSETALAHMTRFAPAADSFRASEQAFGVLTSPYDAFEAAFKHLWANHADVISVLYSGTGAMKTDFTRTGKRTTQGAIDDGWAGVRRYFINNFDDGTNQDAWDLFTGKYVPPAPSSSSSSSPSSSPSSSSLFPKKWTARHPKATFVLGAVLVFVGVALAVSALSVAISPPSPVSTLALTGGEAPEASGARESSIVERAALFGLAAYFPCSRLWLGSAVATATIGLIGYLFLAKGIKPGQRLVAQPSLVPIVPVRGFDRRRWEESHPATEKVNARVRSMDSHAAASH